MARLDLFDLPAGALAAIERSAGDHIVAAATAPGGFTLGPASACTLADGRRIFVKASHPDVSEAVTAMHRREAEVLAELSSDHPSPTLIETFEADGWFGLLLEFADGTTPTGDLASRPEIIDAILTLVATLAIAGAGCPLESARPVGSDPRERASRWAWKKLRDDGQLGELDDWTSTHLDALVELEREWIDAASGDSLVHRDLRADNMILGVVEGGTTGDIAVDWATASRGAAWVDLVGLLPSLALQGGPEPETAFRAHPIGAAAESDAVTCWLASLSGYFTWSALQPAPPGLRRLRRFQQQQGAVTRAWLDQRLGWSQG